MGLGWRRASPRDPFVDVETKNIESNVEIQRFT